jgi:hypothetical protein
MTTYCSVNDSYLNKGLLSTNNAKLDKMARDINNKKKKLERGIEAFNKLQDNNYDKGTRIKKDNNFFSAYETGKDYFPLIKNSSEEVISLDTPSECISDDASSFSSISWETTELDKEIKTKTKFNKNKKSKRHKCTDFDLKSVDSIESIESGESLLRHIRFCLECKDKIMKLIKKNRLELNNKNCSSTIPVVNQLDKQNDVEPETIWKPELKEIFTVFLVGFLVVIILDLFMRHN